MDSLEVVHHRRRVLAEGHRRPVRVQHRPAAGRDHREPTAVPGPTTRRARSSSIPRAPRHGHRGAAHLTTRSIRTTRQLARRGAWCRRATRWRSIYSPLLQGRVNASQGDVWFMSWDGDPALNSGRPHPLGVVVETRGMGWNFPAGNEDIVYFVYTFYNVTSLNRRSTRRSRASMQPILLSRRKRSTRSTTRPSG